MRVVLVCRSGGDYKPQHADWLINQLPRQCEISVITDFVHYPFARGAVPIPLGSPDWPGWWSKMELFRPGTLPDQSLYLDLDTVVKDLPSKYFFNSRSIMLSDFYKPARAASGMMLLHPADCRKVWENWVKDPKGHMLRAGTGGDQAFIGPLLDHDRWQKLYPKEIISYKAQVVRVPERSYDPNEGDLNTANVICFHGKPRPYDVRGESWIPRYAPI